MNWKDFAAAFTEFMKNVWGWMLHIARRHSMALLGSALVVLAAMTVWSWFRDWRTTQFTILVGPGGGMSADDAKRIKNRVEDASGFFATYRVTLEETQGFEEVRRLVNNDRTGRMIGFAHDGFGNAENVRILLPLDNNYLHILGRREFLESVFSPKSPAEQPATTPPATGINEPKDRAPLSEKITFADLAEHKDLLKSGRFSLGPLNSGTRQLAEIVMQRYNLDPDKFQTNGIADWHDMRAGLNNGEIDVAFYGGRMDAEIMKEIAADGNSMLIGLDGDRNAIIQGHLHLLEATFEENSYSNGNFCPALLETFASRRVLLCSSSMSDATAYFLAKSSRDAMRPVVPEIDWVNPPPDSPRSVGLTYQIHPGADRFRTNSPLSTVPWNSNYILLTLALWLATELVQSANKRFRKPTGNGPEGEPAPVPSGNGPPAVVAALTDPVAQEAASRDRYDSLHRENHDDFIAIIASPQLSKAERAQWMQKVEARRGHVKQLRAEGLLLDKHSEALLEAVNDLTGALETRNGQGPKKDPPRRRAVH